MGFSTFRFPTSKAQHSMLSSCINTATAFFFLKVGWVFDVCVVCVFFFFLVEKFNFALRTQAQNSIFFYLNLKNKNVQAETKL